MLKIKKRNGNIVAFDKNKIIEAINKAFIDVDGQLYETDTADDIADDIEKRIIDFENRNLNATTIEEAFQSIKRKITVEEIQDWIEEYLMRSERPDVARAYIRYRYKREIARKNKTEFMEAVGEKLEARNPEGQNANVDERSFGGRIGEASRVLTKQYAIDYLLSEKSKYNHLNNRIYIHDLDSYAAGMHNCLSIPFDDLLSKGFNTRQADVRPANSINTACQLMAVIFQVQSLQQFGGVSATHMDWSLAPYVKKSFYKHYADGLTYLPWDYNKDEYDIESYRKHISNSPSINDEYFKALDNIYIYALTLTERETSQGMEGLVHNLNTLQSRSGN